MQLLSMTAWAALLLGACSGAPAAPTSKPAAGGANTIDLELHGVSMHDTLVIIGQQAHVNFSLDPDIEDTVTITAHAQPWEQVLDTIVKEHDLKVERLTFPKGTVLRISRAATVAPAEQHFDGAPIDVAFDGVPIRTAAETIAELAKVEIVVDDDVQATVTQFARQLPWDLILDHVVRKYSLHIVRSGTTIRIAR
jgi:type II secretory pathway component HofQ